MDAKVLIESFAEFARSKNVDRPTMIRILEDLLFRAMIRRSLRQTKLWMCQFMNLTKRDLEIFPVFREIVDDNSEEYLGILIKSVLTEARKLSSAFWNRRRGLWKKILLEGLVRRAVQMGATDFDSAN